MSLMEEHRCETEAEAKASSELRRYHAKTFMLYYEFRTKQLGPYNFVAVMFLDDKTGPFITPRGLDIRRYELP